MDGSASRSAAGGGEAAANRTAVRRSSSNHSAEAPRQSVEAQFGRICLREGPSEGLPREGSSNRR